VDREDLEIRLLGELAVLRGGRALLLPASKRTRALLGYLVATGEAEPRPRLSELLWEGPLDPRAALRWSLTKLRPLVDDADARRLGGDRERVRFEPLGAEIDLAEVSEVERVLADGIEPASTSTLRAAARRFRGEFLEGLDLPDCYRWHAWLAAGREAWRGRRRAILQALVARLAGSPEEALSHAREWVGIDPLDESAQAAVVRLLGTLGRGREARAQFEACRRMLREELAAEPGEELQAARLTIPRGPRAPEGSRPQIQTDPVPTAGAPSAPLPAIVGRQVERAALARFLAAAAAGLGAPPLLFVGEPGIGKSRLLSELAAEARALGGIALYGRAFEAETVRPYGAWIDALRSASLVLEPDGAENAVSPG
jgi:DNA-binding SARP family transcriptional activator